MEVEYTFYCFRVKSPIDGKPMDGIPSIRVHNGTDYMGTSRFIRWTEVFIIKVNHFSLIRPKFMRYWGEFIQLIQIKSK